MNLVFEYPRNGRLYPEYIRRGNACKFVAPFALEFCKGHGIDVGCGEWPLEGALGVDIKDGGDAMNLPAGEFDYVFSSHALEHLANPVAALEHWRSRIRVGGVLFVSLPHPDMEHWLPQNCRKHLHSWRPREMARLFVDLGFYNVIHSERDLYWSFQVVGFKR